MSKFAISVILGLMLCLTLAACSRPPAATPAGEVAEKGEAIVALLAKGDFAGVTKEFDTTMQKGLSEQQLNATWDSLIAQYGAFQTQKMVSTSQERGIDVATVTCQFANARLKVKVVFNRQLQIIGLWISPAN